MKTKTTPPKNRLLGVMKTVAILSGTTALCFVLQQFFEGTNYVSMVFVLGVFLVARFTDGYGYGIAASLIGVLLVNYIFTYPYFKFNFTLAGYPVAVVTMLAVSLATSALMTQAKESQQSRIEAEREKTRSNLLRAVSHDIRTPLTAILGSTAAIIENDDSLTKAERLSLLCGVRDDAEWLIRMVENLLSITRIDSETRTKLVKTDEAAEEIVAGAVAKFKKRFPEHAVTVSVPDVLLFVPMDGVLIGQVLGNLLENAVLHGKTADRIELIVTRDEKNALFAVRDNGVGIPEDALPQIFDGYFSQPGEGSAMHKRNMGIGLSVCRTIIEAHNGRMTARNLEEGGAEFLFTLPLTREGL